MILFLVLVLLVATFLNVMRHHIDDVLFYLDDVVTKYRRYKRQKH